MHTSSVLNYVYYVNCTFLRCNLRALKRSITPTSHFRLTLYYVRSSRKSVLLTISRKDRLYHAVSTFDEMDIRNILTPYNIMHFHVINSHCPFLIIDCRRQTAQLFINEIILRRITIPFNYITLIEILFFLTIFFYIISRSNCYKHKRKCVDRILYIFLNPELLL